MRDLHVVVPEGLDDPERSSGGNVYDRRVCAGLTEAGWAVHMRAVPGAWPRPDEGSRRLLRAELAAAPADAPVLVDGLIGSAAPEVLVTEGRRVRLCVLVHLPLGATTEDRSVRADEHAVLTAAAGVIATSGWSRSWLLENYRLRPDRVHVAEPGVELGTPARGSDGGGRLLCVAALTPGKGHDVLLRALERVADLAWQCCCVGSLGRDPEHADRMRALARDAGISDRVELVGPRTGDALDEAYAAADLLVLASRFETFGMVVTEALGHGVPVLTSAVGGLPGTLGRLPDGRRPGLLVPPGDPAALAEALRRWLGERELRDSLREAARARRTTLTGWDRTTQQVAGVLEGLAA